MSETPATSESSPLPTSSPTAGLTAALTSLLAAEHAAVYAYGVLGARLDAKTRVQALRAFDAHRVRRNELTVLLRTKGLPSVAAPASYDLAVPDAAAALGLAIRVENELAVRWRDLVGISEELTLRRLAVAGLQDSAVRAVGWRQLAKLLPLTAAFPGQT